MPTQEKKALVAMSGGVDSSVAAVLLQSAGYDVAGVFMHLHDCVKTADVADAHRVAERLNITLHELDMRQDMQFVIRYFADEYRRGRTPNPCAMCNPNVKFAKLIELADLLDIPYVATGHYARIEPATTATTASNSAASTPAPAILRRGLDPAKDQSYALFGLPIAWLARILMPNGAKTKTEIRQIAAENELKTHDKQESQDICFVPDKDYVAFLRSQCPDLPTAGPIVDTQGAQLGTHEGIYQYTIGQRRGLGVALGEPRYVVRIDAAANTVVLGTREELMVKQLTADHVHWLAPDYAMRKSFSATVQIRYNHAGATAKVYPLTSQEDTHDTASEALPARVRVEFDLPVAAVTPGQAAVFYDGDRLVGGGWIESAEPGKAETL